MIFRFVLRTLAAGAVQLIAITFIAWTLFYLIADVTGASPAERVAGKGASQEQIERVAHELGTDRPYWQQYLTFLADAVRLDFGYSYVQNRPVSDIVLPAAATTASLVIGAAVLWLVIAIPVGVIGAVNPRSTADRTLMILVLIGISTPVFWVAPMLSYFLAYQPAAQGKLFGIPLPEPVSIFPIDGYVNLRDDPVQWAHHLMLPWLAFAIGFAAIYARFVRALTIEQLSEDYVRTAYAKGSPRWRVLARHVGRNIAPVVVTLLALDVGVALGGALFVERVFALPGLGYVGLSSIQTLDYPLVSGVITFAAVFAVLANTIADLAHGALDPRVREGGT